MKPEYEELDSRVRETISAERYELFGDLIHAVLKLETCVERREFVRWKEDELYDDELFDADCQNYEQLEARVRAAANEIVDKALTLATRGGVARLVANERKRLNTHLVDLVRDGRAQ